jgi:ribonuclease HI
MDEDGRLRDATGTLANSTNNRAELIAAVEALRQFPSQSNLRLVCPSQYLLNYEWSLPEWKQNGWKNAARKPVANSDEWVEFDKIACRRNVSLVEKSNDPRSLTPYARQLAKDKCKEIKT